MRRPSERGRSGCIFAALAAILVVLVIGAGLLLYGRSQLDAPAAAAGQPVPITVRAGESVDTLIADLDRHGLVRSTFWFSWYARLQGLASKLVAGQFLLNDGMSASLVVHTLESTPQVQTAHLVLPEGLTAAQMAQRVAASGLHVTAAQYLYEVQHGSFTEPFLSGRPAGASLEGFLFPDTYDVPVNATAHDVVEMQLADFGRKAMPLLGGLSPQSLYSTLIVASITEREARFQADRALVASVIDNRLAAGMRLQVDSSVLYGLGVTGGAITAAQLAADTPYNTYLHAGLPPTPISNPGVSSISAAAHPGSTQFLYFVSDCTGHNHYSVSEQVHEQQVAQYLSRPCS